MADTTWAAALGVLKEVLRDLAFPLLVGGTIWLLDKRRETQREKQQERKARRETARYGSSIIACFLEEIQTGIETMTQVLAQIQANNAQLPTAQLPTKSWETFAPIPRDVVLMILDLSEGGTFSGLQPKDIQVHCKNYFVMMCQNYNKAIVQAHEAVALGSSWFSIVAFWVGTGRGQGDYIRHAQAVHDLLSTCKALLDRNASA